MAEKNSTVFVICEYNPFHYGHEYQLLRFREKYETVICVMSGDAVQRGEAAVYSKYARAEAAVMCGANAVFELPFPFSCMAAPDFAFGGVYAALALGCDVLGFSADTDAKTLVAAANSLPDRDEVTEYLKKHKNLSYPKAVCEMMSFCGDLDPTTPNNILGMEYIRTAKALGRDLDFEVIRRDHSFESSSRIRGYDDMLSKIPEKAAAVLSNHNRRDNKALDSALMAAARKLHVDSNVYGMTSGDIMRLKKAALCCGNAFDTVKTATSATLTAARARRGMLCALLGITREDVNEKPLFLRLLALDEKGAEYISKNKKRFELPIVSKRSHISSLGARAIEQYERALESESVLALTERENAAFDGINRKSVMIDKMKKE